MGKGSNVVSSSYSLCTRRSLQTPRAKTKLVIFRLHLHSIPLCFPLQEFPFSCPSTRDRNSTRPLPSWRFVFLCSLVFSQVNAPKNHCVKTFSLSLSPLIFRHGASLGDGTHFPFFYFHLILFLFEGNQWIYVCQCINAAKQMLSTREGCFISSHRESYVWSKRRNSSCRAEKLEPVVWKFTRYTKILCCGWVGPLQLFHIWLLRLDRLSLHCSKFQNHFKPTVDLTVV